MTIQVVGILGSEKYFSFKTLEKIKLIPTHDLRWFGPQSPVFSIKGAMYRAQQIRRPFRLFLEEEDWSKLWKLHLQDRLKLLLWKVAAGAIPIRTPSYCQIEGEPPPNGLY